MDELPLFAKWIVSLVAMLNPPGAIPTFLAVSEGSNDRERRRMARIAGVAVVGLLVGAVVFGQTILGYFGISMSAFRAAGGILLLLMAISMLQGRMSPSKQSPEETQDAEAASDKLGAAVVPIALPLIAGPGSISTAVIYANQCRSSLETVLLIVAALVVGALVWIVLSLAAPIGRRLGRTGIRVTTRLMGLLLAAIAVEFIATGLRELLPGLGGPA